MTTTTEHGISVKDLIGLVVGQCVSSDTDSKNPVATSNGAIYSIPRRVLDPRRTKNKPSAAEAEEEWLSPYDPVVPDDPKRTISHKYDVSLI